MAVRNKYFVPNKIYFLTFTILGWKNIFINDKYCALVYKNNPCVKHWRLADCPENYKHSSASNYYLGKGFYDVDLMELWL
jgi:hypothetical protein